MFQEQVGMVVLNPTNEDFDMQYSGVSFTIKAGYKQTLSANAANHILNAYGPRGLSYLQFGADEDKIAAAGKQRNEDFKRRQVTEFNIRNENRKNMNMGYLPPSGKVKEYALELGLELMQPYAPRDAEREKINEQNKEIEALRKSNADIMEKLDMLLATKDVSKETSEPEKKPFACENCGASFTTNLALVGHMRSHKKDDQ
jgi:hypothetical protein